LPIALRLLAAGFRVAGNCRHEPPAAFVDAGGFGCDTAADLADQCDVVFTVLPSADALISTAIGEHGLVSSTRRAGIWVEMSTVPETVKRPLADSLAEHGWRALDCPISGAPDQLQAGQAVLLSSGSRDVHEQVEPVLQAISPNVRYMGIFGHGMRAKYTAYLMLAGHSLVAAEALAFAGYAGLDLSEILAALRGTIVSSAVFDRRAPRVLDPSGTPAGLNLPALAETLTQLDQFARERGLATPVLDQVRTHLDRRDVEQFDELVVAFYHQLTAKTDTSGPKPSPQEHK
jgi:3-hydroxyisobutyrate dehydrogenase-like beta-hydroxyacid dehydrogenase